MHDSLRTSFGLLSDCWSDDDTADCDAKLRWNLLSFRLQ